MTLSKRAYAWYNTEIGDWYAASGEYEILVGSSSRDIRLRDTVEVTSTKRLPVKIDMNTAVAALLSDPRLAEVFAEYQQRVLATFGQSESEASKEAISDEMTYQMLVNFPLRALRSFANLQDGELEALISRLQTAVDTEG